MSTDERIFKTSDYKLAAFLLARDIPLHVTRNPRRPTKVEFFAPVTDELLRNVAAFAADEAVPVQTFLESMESIKDQMMSLTREVQRD